MENAKKLCINCCNNDPTDNIMWKTIGSIAIYEFIKTFIKTESSQKCDK